MIDVRVVNRPLEVVILRLCQLDSSKEICTNLFLIIGYRSAEPLLNERYGVSSRPQVSSIIEEVDEWSEYSLKISSIVKGEEDTHGLRLSGIREIITAFTTTRRAKVFEASMNSSLRPYNG